jgi:hypothetical protein
MSRNRRFFAGACSAAVLVAAGWLVMSPLRWSEASIRASLLKQTPLGSSSGQVRGFVMAQGWLDRNYIGNRGFLKTEIGVPVVQERAVGATSIRGELGHYQSVPFQTYVTAFWGFDTNDQLIDVWVWKTTDGL